eukprot:INCI5005.1.p1 GENE.INCI5005.1~~INCI5005.1.p1  ORF type:complete len:112 (-),score=17.50 INCI5005.1:276-611(-)
MSANWRITWLEQTGIPERKAQLEDRSHGQDASTEENNGNSEHRTNGTTEEPPRNRQQTPRQTTNYDKTNNRYNRTRSHRSTHQISAQQKVTTKAKQANFKTTTRTAQSEEV